MKPTWLLFAFGLFCLDSVHGWSCLQGFSATIFGVPLSHWGKNYHWRRLSPCFMQELVFPFQETKFEVKVQYGGAISKAYTKLITCENLFGEDSNLKLAQVFEMLPKLDEMYEDITDDFIYVRLFESYRELFSNGTGMESFINGCFTLLENLGLNVTNGQPLKSKFKDFMEAVLPGYSYVRGGFVYVKRNESRDNAVKEFLDTLRKVLDAYQADYPDSQVPDSVWKFAEFIRASYRLEAAPHCGEPGANNTELTKCHNDYNEGLWDINTLAIDAAVDFQFAIDEEFDFDYLDLYEEIRKAFPDFESFIRLWKVLDREDIKQLYRDVYSYILIVDQLEHMRDGFFTEVEKAFNQTLRRVETKFRVFLSDLKEKLSPRSCRYYKCRGQNCATLEKLADATKFIINKESTTPTTTQTSTTSEETTP